MMTTTRTVLKEIVLQPMGFLFDSDFIVYFQNPFFHQKRLQQLKLLVKHLEMQLEIHS